MAIITKKKKNLLRRTLKCKVVSHDHGVRGTAAIQLWQLEITFYCVPVVRLLNRSIILPGDQITFIRAIWTGLWWNITFIYYFSRDKPRNPKALFFSVAFRNLIELVRRYN